MDNSKNKNLTNGSPKIHEIKNNEVIDNEIKTHLLKTHLKYFGPFGVYLLQASFY